MSYRSINTHYFQEEKIMKTSAIIFAAVIAGTTFAATSAMAQQSGIGGKLTYTSTVKLNGKLGAGKGAKVHLGTGRLKNSRIGGNANLKLKSIIDGPVTVKKNGRLGHGSFGMYNSQITGDVKADLYAKSTKITVDQNAKVFVGAVDMYNQSKINGNLDITAKGKTGTIKAGRNSIGLVSALQMNGSTINGNAKFNLNSKTGNLTLGKDAQAYIASALLANSTVGGPMSMTSTVKLGNTKLGKGANFAAGAVILNNAHIGGGLEFTSYVTAGNITLADGADVSLGSFQSN